MCPSPAVRSDPGPSPALSLERLDAALDALGPGQRAVATAIRAAGPRAGLVLEPARDGHLTGHLDGLALASRVRPREEGERLAATVDVLEHAAVVVHGFGLGWHVAALARRMGRTGAVLVVEPDLALLHSVLGTADHAAWIREANLILVTDPDDRATLMRHVHGAEFVLAQGTAFLDHPPSRARLGDAPVRFGRVMRDVAVHVKLTLSTTLVRAFDSVNNLTGNLHRFAVAPGIDDLAGRQAGRPAILVAAGPSAGPQLDRLADPGLRDRAVIIAAQTMLRPLLARGIRPHFVTALDYHRISTRFYEGLTAEDVTGVTLVVDPKAHPAILDAFPGVVRCIDNGFLRQVLGPLARPMGDLPPGATVAHLSAELARHLGCDPLVLVGQDLGFTDGLYYGAGAAIHDTWAGELGPFNPVTEMEWQRIVRHRRHLVQLEAWNGDPVLSDTQMLTYLQRFEQDFAGDAEAGRRVIDASGPGTVRKAGTSPMDLDAVIESHARRPLAPMPIPAPERPDAAVTRTAAARRVRTVRHDVAGIATAARAAGRLIERMLEAQDDPAAMRSLFERLDRHRTAVGARTEAFALVDHLNQLGAFNRVRADRRLALADDLDARARQRIELERDAANVAWIGDAADALGDQLDAAIGRLEGRPPAARRPRRRPAAAAPPTWPGRRAPADRCDEAGAASGDGAPARLGAVDGEDLDVEVIAAAAAADGPADTTAAGPVGAVLAVDAADLDRLRRPFGATTVLGATLDRLGDSERLDVIVVVAEAAAARAIDWPAVAGRVPVRIIESAEPPLGPRGHRIRSARAFAPGAWRGGIAGLGGLDAGVSATALRRATDEAGLAVAVAVAPDRPLLDAAAGIDALVDRWREHPGVHRLVFSPLPPGLGGVLLRADLARDLAGAGRLGFAGAMLVHQPAVPQGDPLATDACVPVPPEARRAVDAIAATPAAVDRLAAVASAWPGAHAAGRPDAAAIVAAVEAAEAAADAERPRHLILELRTLDPAPPFARRCGAPAPDPRAPVDVREADADALVAALAACDLAETAVTLTGTGDAAGHPRWAEIAAAARAAGSPSVHLRTRLDLDPAEAAAIAGAVDVVSLDLHARTPGLYRRMHGTDAFDRVHAAVEALVAARGGGDAAGGPWIVPRLVRGRATLPELDAFHEYWQHRLGCVLVEPRGEPFAADGALVAPHPDDPLDGADPALPIACPPAVARRELDRRLRVRVDGSMPADETDDRGVTTAATLAADGLAGGWARVRAARTAAATAGAPPRILEP